MKTRKKSYLLAGVIAIVAVFFATRWAVQSYQAAQKSQSGKIQIVASTNVWGDIAAQIGGDQVNVTSILSDPSADPHLFESDAKTASQIEAAQLVIVNGLGYDEFMDKLLETGSNGDKVLTVSDVLRASPDANPHLWYNLSRILEVATAIQNYLIKIDPEHADEYRRNTAKFIAEMQPVIARVTPRSGGVAYTERVAEYLLNDLGLENKTPEGFSQSVENGTEPTPQQLQEFEQVLTSGKVSVLVYNNQTVNDVTKQLETSARAAGVVVVGVSETIPKGKNFQTWQLDQLNAILKAL
jgi:zinc/manganese transport system substrate-binding protein